MGGWPTTGNFLKKKAQISQSRLFKAIGGVPGGRTPIPALPKIGNMGVSFLGMHNIAWVLNYVLGNSTLKNMLYVNTTNQAFIFTNKAKSGLQTVSAYMSSKSLTGATLAAQYVFSANEVDTFNTSQMWAAYEKRLMQLDGLLNYRPVALAAANYTIKKWWNEDQVLWIDIHKKMGTMYTVASNGDRAPLPMSAEVQEWINLRRQIATPPSTDPNYLWQGFGLIVTIPRMDPKILAVSIGQYNALFNNYRGTVIGFDMEGDGNPVRSQMYSPDVIDALRRLSNMGAPLFLHAGLTHWPQDMAPGETVNPPENNLYDTILLKPRRLLHGWNLYQHPKLLETMVVQQQLPITVCPIMEQMFGYSKDLRDHPAVAMMRAGVPVLIGSCAPGILGYDSISYDYYMAYMGWGLSVPAIKTQLINNIFLSSMPSISRMKVFRKFQSNPRMWNFWQTGTLRSFCNPRRPPPIPKMDITKIKLASNCTVAGGKLKFILPQPISACIPTSMGWGPNPTHLQPCENTGPQEISCVVPSKLTTDPKSPSLNGTWTICLSLVGTRNCQALSIPAANVADPNIPVKVSVYVPPPQVDTSIILSCSYPNMTKCMMMEAMNKPLTTNCTKNLAFAGCAFDSQCVDMASQFCYQRGDNCASGMCNYISSLSTCDTAKWAKCRAKAVKAPDFCSKRNQLMICAQTANCGDMAIAASSLKNPLPGAPPCL
eukprot:TRINITY_DN54446_c0_g1_i1.p1 TRINITY_DN54446_c0_g1~~TRINITY_DN54446_c0_g1_i1.p1  ORF type:complete len:807 (-),score=53.13 TRINITY_DN54446_c0_g1_i1:47-2182(-)